MGIDVTQMIEPAKKLAEPFTATLSDTWSAVIGDRVAAWRLKNAAALQIQVNEEVAKVGLQLDRSKIPERYAFAWFEEATKQDEPEIQTLFARLLARAAAGDEDAADRRNLEILTHFTPMDATVMEWIITTHLRGSAYGSIGFKLAQHIVKNEFGDKAVLALEHLVTLGVLEHRFHLSNHRGHMSGMRGRAQTLADITREIQDRFSVEGAIALTARGLALYKSCRVPDQKEQEGE